MRVKAEDLQVGQRLMYGRGNRSEPIKAVLPTGELTVLVTFKNGDQSILERGVRYHVAESA